MSPRGLVIGGLSAGVCALVVVWCGCGARQSYAHYERPIASDDVEAGRLRYFVVCAPCHEQRGERNAPSLAHLSWSPGRVRRQVREGSMLMPPIRPNRLSDDELEDVLAYFADIGAVVETEGPEEWAAMREPIPPRDAGLDAGARDAGTDVGPPSLEMDARLRDASGHDASGPDAAVIDGGDAADDARDAGAADAPTVMDPWQDAGTFDRDAAPDGGGFEAGIPDGGTPDAGTPDSGTPDAGAWPSGRELANPRR